MQRNFKMSAPFSYSNIYVGILLTKTPCKTKQIQIIMILMYMDQNMF